MKKPVSPDILKTWVALNEFIISASETQAAELLALEQGGKARLQFMKRIQSRLNRLRSQRALKELVFHGKSP